MAVAASYADARARVGQLVTRFSRLSAHNRKAYNEAATRQEFILPLFRALGWNTEDTHEVSPEEQVSRGFVDFAFRLHGIPCFFLETKKIPADLEDPRWAQQAINYAWLKGVTWAVLTDFEGLKVFNAGWQEAIPARAIFKDLHWQQYLERFDELWLLSRPAMEQAALDRAAEAVGRKVRKTPVSRLLFADLTDWRRALVQTLRAYNPERPVEQIDEAVQRTLDRLIFIRTCEDRGIEPYRLRPMVREWRDQGRKKDLVTDLNALFRGFDQGYDSRLFAPHLCEELTSEPGPYERVIEGLYTPPGGYGVYDFNAIDADVLGTIYEQYLGHRALDPKGEQVADRRAKRKAQGIYYTPQFVVRYIVQQTLGRLLQEADYQRARQVKVLDMACGSGSFLIEAFGILDRYFAKVRGQGARVSQPVLREGTEVGVAGDTHDLARRMEILSNNLYGVDLDGQAVEIAQLNLLLRAVNQRGRLPSLDNIRQGNSLISGTPAELAAAFGPAWSDKRPFNWAEQFPRVTETGGFDVIVGNPPYGIIFDAVMKQYLEREYSTFARNNDQYVAFVQRALQLLRPGGLFGFILPNTFLLGPYFDGLKRYVLQTTRVLQLVDFGACQVFEEPNVFSAIMIVERAAVGQRRVRNQVEFLQVHDLESFPEAALCHRVAQSDLATLHWVPPNALVARLTRLAPKLRDIAFVKDVGLNYWTKGRGKLRGGSIADRVLYMGARRADGDIPYLKGRDIDRYVCSFGRHWLRGDYKKLLDPSVDTLRFSPDFLLRDQKILYRQTADRIVATIDRERYLTDKTLHTVVLKGEGVASLDIRYLLGILNSKLATFIYQDLAREEGRTFAQVKVFRMECLPIRQINFDDPADRARHHRMVALVEEMLRLRKEHAQAEAQREDLRHDLARQIRQLEAQIDALVYELYGLSGEEVRLVESAETDLTPRSHGEGQTGQSGASSG
jgi:hypothetical protein